MSADAQRIRIRRLRAGEGPRLRDVRLRSLADSPDAYGQTAAAAAAEPDALWAEQARTGARGQRRTWIVAERLDGDVPGTLVGVATGRRRLPDTLLVFSVWVAPEVRGTGTGRALIAACEAWGRTWGAQRTLLWVVRGNTAALAFYAALGFLREEATEDAARGAAFDAWALSRPIPPAPLPRAGRPRRPSGDRPPAG